MKHAIATLQIALDTATNNEPIHRAEGNTEQADLCLEVIKDCELAIRALDDHPNVLKDARDSIMALSNECIRLDHNEQVFARGGGEGFDAFAEGCKQARVTATAKLYALEDRFPEFAISWKNRPRA